MKRTKIQWCHSTVNPVMGCDGCELWKPAASLSALLVDRVALAARSPRSTLAPTVASIIGTRTTSELYRDRVALCTRLADETRGGPDDEGLGKHLVTSVRKECKCYAGLLGTFRAGQKGYADRFERPKLYPGRMEKASKWGLPTSETNEKPWLRSLPRLIFVSDMGDALSRSVPFEYLHKEIIENVNSEPGQRHIWLWLTKRPERMAKFGDWLTAKGIEWPDNLVAMTTVTSTEVAHRIDSLRKVPSKLKGLSCEPLFGPVDLDLRGIEWVIVGGGSDTLAEPFHVEWALNVQRSCQLSGAAFFLKQLGRNPFFMGEPLQLEDEHGGDWNEWPEQFRIRELPSEFKKVHRLPAETALLPG